MSTNKWDDEKLKTIFSDMPTIKDTRTKEELLTQIKLDERLKEVKPKRPMRWAPAFVTVSALLILSLFLPSMLGGNEDKASDSNAVIGSESSDAVTESQDLLIIEEESTIEANFSNESSKANVEAYSSPAYAQDVADGTVFHLGLASDAASSIPVTFIIPNTQIKEDFGKLKPTSLELYEKYADQLDEAALGFLEYHPYKGSIVAVKNKLIHILPNGHGYDRASAAMGVYMGTLQETFYGFQEISFQNEDGSVVEFDQVGEPSDPIQLTSGKTHYNYYLFRQDSGMEFLASNFSKSYETLEQALLEMKKSPNDIYATVIPEHIHYRVTSDAGVTKVTFTEEVDLDALDLGKALQMIEGLMLTAASFDQQLQFENIMQTNWHQFDFSQPLAMPIGPNLMPYLVK